MGNNLTKLPAAYHHQENVFFSYAVKVAALFPGRWSDNLILEQDNQYPKTTFYPGYIL